MQSLRGQCPKLAANAMLTDDYQIPIRDNGLARTLYLLLVHLCLLPIPCRANCTRIVLA
jgi:hypothetical protein